MDEPLNETASMSHFPSWQREGNGLVMRGSHRLLLSPWRHAMAELRELVDQLFLPPTLFYATNDNNDNESKKKNDNKDNDKKNDNNNDDNSDKNKAIMAAKAQQILSEDLPVNVHVVTLEAVGSRSLLVRLGHQFAVGEDPKWSGEVEVDLKQLLKAFEVSSCEGLNLSANQLWAEQEAKKIRWKSVVGERGVERVKGPVEGCIVRLTAMQIKTLLVQL